MDGQPDSKNNTPHPHPDYIMKGRYNYARHSALHTQNDDPHRFLAKLEDRQAKLQSGGTAAHGLVAGDKDDLLGGGTIGHDAGDQVHVQAALHIGDGAEVQRAVSRRKPQPLHRRHVVQRRDVTQHVRPHALARAG